MGKGKGKGKSKAKAGPPAPPPKPYQFNVDDFEIETGQKVIRWNPSRDPVDPVCTQEYHIRLSVGRDPESNKPKYDLNYWKPKYIDRKAEFEPPPLPRLPTPPPTVKPVKKKRSARTGKKTKKTTVAHLKMSPDIDITFWRVSDTKFHAVDMNPHVVNRPDNIMHVSNAPQDWTENFHALESGNHSNDSWKTMTIFSENSTINVSYQENTMPSGKLLLASNSSQKSLPHPNQSLLDNHTGPVVEPNGISNVQSKMFTGPHGKQQDSDETLHSESENTYFVECKNISGSWITLTNSTDIEREIDVTDFDEMKPDNPLRQSPTDEVWQSPTRSDATKDEPKLILNRMCQTSLKFDCATVPQFVIDNDWASDVIAFVSGEPMEQ
uniref:Uncharacterized protein n=1 Tax=Cacopsylla melanoneura TaxID=428564 RepID=A0A8D8R1V8_9HEMI